MRHFFARETRWTFLYSYTMYTSEAGISTFPDFQNCRPTKCETNGFESWKHESADTPPHVNVGWRYVIGMWIFAPPCISELKYDVYACFVIGIIKQHNKYALLWIEFQTTVCRFLWDKSQIMGSRKQGNLARTFTQPDLSKIELKSKVCARYQLSFEYLKHPIYHNFVTSLVRCWVQKSVHWPFEIYRIRRFLYVRWTTASFGKDTVHIVVHWSRSRIIANQ